METSISNEKLRSIAGALLNNLYLDQEVPKEKLAELTFESEFQSLLEPQEKLIKMSKKEHIDSFFKDGTLRLGTFKDYQKSENEEIGDKSEGCLLVIGRNSKRTGIAHISSGFNNFVFCCFDGEADQTLVGKFDYDDYFFIDNPNGFAQAIADRLPCPNIYRSRCVYRNDKVLVGTPPPNFNFYKMSHELRNLVNWGQYFIKPVRFSHQKEYRFIWELDEDIDEPFLMKCPEAVEYCSRPAY
ncbi:hypothetical protein BFP97_10205 [Roseivirga sp. 4D4]|nr:hypothetical protein BFP97_10205 [Roseivirga sp. 4D4]